MPADDAAIAAQPVTGASILIAGASGGLGSAIASELDRRGASLTLVARSAERLARLRSPVPASPPIYAHRKDVSARVEAHAGGLDVVVNAVGVVAFGPAHDALVASLCGSMGRLQEPTMPPS